MRYLADGKTYGKLKDLLFGGPIGKLHPTAQRLFVEDGHLFVVLEGKRGPTYAYAAPMTSFTPPTITIDLTHRIDPE